ncbi:hypothetical protein GWI33_016031 [Rhynchophorus ferrugineus]|uniref:Odorant receptor n=1 Tax=Rhynchophorus ferrugineus TaxID=354439 RepID=A0A834I2I0_RHYFE|nr:hypothetical protein GWI33_016031 [Rhynchophorus ferrugineus]
MFVEFFFLLGDEDVKKLTDNIQITITCSLAGVKAVIYQSDNFAHLINTIIKEERVLLQSKDENIKNLYWSFVKYINKCAIAIVVIAGGTAGLLVVATSTIGLLSDSDDKPMIFLAHFPFNQKKHYFTSILIQASSVGVATVYYCMSQILYLCILTFVKAKLKVLQYHFRCFKIENGTNDAKRARELVKYHQRIIRFVEKLNDSIKYLLLIEFLSSSLNIASVMYQLLSAQTLTDIIFSISYLMVLIGQLFILAWHANEIKVESVAVSDAAYDSSWYASSYNIKQMIQMVIMRSNKPLLLTIGPFNPLTTQTVISVINAAYSYVMIMTNGNDL